MAAEPDIEPVRARLGALAWLLDSSIRIPGTRWRIGLDALLGVVPGIGDAAGAALSGVIVLAAARMGAPRAVLMRMLLNVAVEVFVGAIPVAGDLFDAGWKANERNVALLDEWLGRARRPAPAAPRALLTALTAVLVVLLVLAGALLALVAWWIVAG